MKDRYHFLFASDSFKGTLTCQDTIRLLTQAAQQVFSDAVCEGVPVADGGEGTVDSVLAAEGGELVSTTVHGPLMEERKANYGIISGNRAVIEMSAASGLPLVPMDQRNPLLTTSYGTGELILDALERGIRDISVAIGGSATNDGGMGFLSALGVRFLDQNGNILEGRGESLDKVRSIDLSGLDPRIKNTRITVMCDVTNPLTGQTGATMTYGKQKGGTPEILERLEAGMCIYREVVLRETGVDADKIQGSGAAGGLGAALAIFLGGEMRSGIETVLNLVHFKERLSGVDLVITGEGCADRQSCYGKVMQGVGQQAKALDIPVIGLCGSLGEGYEELFKHGITKLLTTTNTSIPLEEIMNRAEELYLEGAIRMFEVIKSRGI